MGTSADACGFFAARQTIAGQCAFEQLDGDILRFKMGVLPLGLMNHARCAFPQFVLQIQMAPMDGFDRI